MKHINFDYKLYAIQVQIPEAEAKQNDMCTISLL